MKKQRSLVLAVILILAIIATSASLQRCAATSGNEKGGAAQSAAKGESAGPTCEKYCDVVMGGCMGPNQQYASRENCMNACSAFPMGGAGDTNGDTVGCRIYHGTVASKSSDNAVIHCPHAGPGGAGHCGSNCEGYCDIAQKFCTGAAKIYNSRSDCMDTCKATPDDVDYNITVNNGAHVACLLYHAQEAATMPADHCLNHLAKTSTMCK